MSNCPQNTAIIPLNQEKYRIGVSYDKAYANLKSYVQAGGQAQWNFIVFKHNEQLLYTNLI